MTQGERTGRKGRRRFGLVDAVATLMLVVGLAFVGYYAWEFYGTGIVTQRAVDEELQGLQEQWQRPEPQSGADSSSDEPVEPQKGETPGAVAPPDTSAGTGGEPGTRRPPKAGRAAWIIRIPRLGESYEWPIVAGIEPRDLARGVGWFPTTAQPGEIGNFALAGHRVTHGEPFRNLLRLRVGDEVIIETRDAVYTYEMTSAPKDLTVKFTENWVLDPVPGKPGEQPTEAIITLTTCQSFFHTPDRSVGFGVLVSTTAK